MAELESIEMKMGRWCELRLNCKLNGRIGR